MQKRISVLITVLIAALFHGCKSDVSKKDIITVDMGEWRPIPKNLLGANANLISLNHPWESEELIEVTQGTNISTLRYPGGTIGNYWDWDIGAIDRSVPDSLMIKWVVANNLAQSPNRYTLENLAEMYGQTGIVPVFMLNMLSKDLEHSIRNLKRANSLGIPIKYIEMGNELYFNIPFPLLKYPTPEAYGKTCQNWIEALKKEFPEASFAVVGNYLTRHPRQMDWNKRVLEKCNNADALTLHLYSPSGLDGRSERRRIIPGKEGLGAARSATRTGPEEIAERQRWELELLKEKRAYANMFTTAEKNLKKLGDFYIPDEMDLWVTEFNIRDDRSIVLHSWAQSLILSRYLFKFLEKGVELSHMHNLTGPLFGMIHTDTLNYQHLKYKKVNSTPYALSAGGMITKLFQDVMAGTSESTELHFDPLPVLTDDRGTKCGSLKGRIFKNDGEKAAIILNYDVVEKKIQFKEMFGFYGAEVSTYSSDPSSPVNGFENITANRFELNDTLGLPPYSITLIRF